MKEPALVIIKPDAIKKGLLGAVLSKFSEADLEIIGIKIVRATKALAESHYQHLRDKPFFPDLVNYFIGKFHQENKLWLIVYYAKEAIRKCRKIAGATNPEEADPLSLRGSLGRITTRGLFENVVHVSESKKEAFREIKLWFSPEEISLEIYPAKKVMVKNYQQKVWYD